MTKKYNPKHIPSGIGLIFFIFVALNAIFSRPPLQTTKWTAPQEAVDLKNPLVANSSVLTAAKSLYTANCGPCHGDKGRGDGPAAPGLNPRPADHSSAAVQSETDGSLFWKLTEGRTPMPSYKKIFTDEQRWQLVLYIRTLAKGAKKK